ncbi:jg24354, partial [Pararge aegeria aegeria]
MMKTIVVPILKNKTGDIADQSNYRPISIAGIIAKVLDSLLDIHLAETLKFHDAQFGFQAGLSTETAILSLKQTVQYYTSKNTPVYACFLDLSKAFDLVSYDVLWDKMKRAGVQPEVLNIMRFWYANQLNCVRWGREFSEPY